ncbi:hypothetical protein ACLOJK_026156 [Asimina triloba]
MQSAGSSQQHTPTQRREKNAGQQKKQSRAGKKRTGEKETEIRNKTQMAILPAFSPTHLAVFLLLALAAVLPLADAGDHSLGWFPHGPACTGSIAECLDGADEFAMESEMSRRILATSRYISYAALRRNSIPCSRRGASYYNCRPGAQANPYRRGCSAITRCRN